MQELFLNTVKKNAGVFYSGDLFLLITIFDLGDNQYHILVLYTYIARINSTNDISMPIQKKTNDISKSFLSHGFTRDNL